LTILRFRQMLEMHKLVVDMLQVVNDLLQHHDMMMRNGTAVDATLDLRTELDEERGRSWPRRAANCNAIGIPARDNVTGIDTTGFPHRLIG